MPYGNSQCFIPRKLIWWLRPIYAEKLWNLQLFPLFKNSFLSFQNKTKRIKKTTISKYNVSYFSICVHEEDMIRWDII